jgi:hypothetical protein
LIDFVAAVVATGANTATIVIHHHRRGAGKAVVTDGTTVMDLKERSTEALLMNYGGMMMCRARNHFSFAHGQV